MEDYFEAATIQRGKRYFYEERVQDIWIADNDHVIDATVTGSGRKHYSVNIALPNFGSNRSDLWSLRSRCSCPVGHYCKHAVATLFELEELLDRNGLLVDMGEGKQLTATSQAHEASV